MPKTTNEFHEANRASEVLSKIGSGAADADFARAIHEAIDRVQQTNKKAKVRVEVEISPDNEKGALFLRSRVTAKLPELPPPASQMHVGAGGQLLTQMEWLMGGGRDERPTPVEQADAAARAEATAAPAPPATPSGRFPVAKAPAPAPLASAPAPKPIAGDAGKKE